MDSNITAERTRSHPLATFLTIAFAFSWLIEIPLALEARGIIDSPIPFSFHYLAAFGPLLAAVIVTWHNAGREGLRDLLQRMLKWRVNVGWWLAAVAPLWLFLLLIAVQQLFIGARPDLGGLGRIDYLPYQGLGALLWWILTFGIGEESGWRGFFLPHLQNGRSALRATIILWFFWALWHLPLFYYQYDPVTLPGFLISLLAGAITLTWLYNSSRGSILLAAVWHGAFNYVTACVNCKYGLSPLVMSVVIMILAVLIVIVFKPATLSSQKKQVAL